jgi:hypothetical protein
MIVSEHVYKGFRIVKDTNMYTKEYDYYVEIPCLTPNTDYDSYFKYVDYIKAKGDDLDTYIKHRFKKRLKDVKADIDEYLKGEI